MKLKIAAINVEDCLKKARKRSDHSFQKELSRLFAADEKREDRIRESLENGNFDQNNQFDLEKLETDRIYHIEHIQKICVNYRLRFLSSKFFKSEIPYEAMVEIKSLEKQHECKLNGFRILAPSKLFKLENADDPLLFAPIGNDYYYLVHKWGNDLSPFRKIIMWPFKNLENFILLLLAISFVTALLIPEGLFTKGQASTTQFFMIFFFVFKWFAGLSIFYGFKKGKNFSSAIWDSKYYNA